MKEAIRSIAPNFYCRVNDSDMAQRLKDQIALVIGAGSIRPGVSTGKATSILYAREGATVIAVELAGSLCIVTLSLGPTRVLLRQSSLAAPEVGARVGFTVDGPAHVFA